MKGSTGRGRGDRQDLSQPMRFGSYNICNGWNGVRDSDLCGMFQANFDLGVFQETKVTRRDHTRESSRYRVVMTDPPILHRGSVAVFYREAGHFSLENLCLHGSKNSQIPVGDRVAAVAYHGALYCSRRCLKYIGCRCGHRQAAPRCGAAGFRRLQCVPDQSRRERVHGGYHCGTDEILVRVKECPFPLETKILVKGWAHM